MTKKSLGINLIAILILVAMPAFTHAEGMLGVNVFDPQSPIDVSSAGIMRSQFHFSLDGSDVGGWITSVLDNNFFLSSGIKYDSVAGGWVQKSPDGQSVIVGTQTFNGYQVFLQTGCTVGQVCQVNERLRINYNGHLGLGTKAGTAYPIHMAGGARCTGTQWLNASGREFKENINELSSSEALLAFNKLTPVTFNYKTENNERHVGFIAEDVPDLVATPDRKALSTMDIVAVLTKVVQEQQKTISELKEKVSQLEAQIK